MRRETRRGNPAPSSWAPQTPEARRAFTTLTLGLAQAIAAHSYGNAVGVAFGAAAFALGTALWALSPAPPRPLRVAAQALSAFVLVLLAVRVASPDPQHVSGFPASCPAGLQGRHGCSRVALTAPHRAPPPPLDAPFAARRASLADVERELLRWVAAQPRRVTVLQHVRADGKEGEGFMHLRAVTPVFGFADDVFVRWRCVSGAGGAGGAGGNNGGSGMASRLLGAVAGVGREEAAVVEVQGQLRLGVGDLGVNVRRNADLLRHLQGASLPAAARCR